MRRCNELKERGQQADFEGILRDVMDRDYRDINREIAPLRQARDAVLVDTTELTLDQSFEKLHRIAKETLFDE